MGNPKQKSSQQASKHQTSKKSGASPWLWIGLGVALVVLIGTILWLRGGTNSATASLPPEINVSQAADKRAAGAFILDVREPSEWEVNHIPGATLIPLSELANRVSEVPADQEVVVVCRSGNRSQQGRDVLKSAGFDQVTSMAGGMNEWMAAGLEWVSGQ